MTSSKPPAPRKTKVDLPQAYRWALKLSSFLPFWQSSKQYPKEASVTKGGLEVVDTLEYTNTNSCCGLKRLSQRKACQKNYHYLNTKSSC